MPELPEVETVRAGLEPRLLGQRIARVTLNRPDIRIPIPKDFIRRVQGGRIEAVRRRAKYLLMPLDRGDAVILHLGMSGRILIRDAAPNRYEKHDHAVFHLEDGAAVIFNDARRFGILTLARTAGLEAHPLLVRLGHEPLEEGFTASALKSALSRRKSAIKMAIMDQERVVGVGNIYASEALFRARIRPDREAGSLSLAECRNLVESIRAVLTEAIASGGSTLRDYVRSDGDLGYFQHRFQVYGRDGESCVSCGHPIRKSALAGRSTYFCAACQR